jgi:hypothetical protein
MTRNPARAFADIKSSAFATFINDLMKAFRKPLSAAVVMTMAAFLLIHLNSEKPHSIESRMHL